MKLSCLFGQLTGLILVISGVDASKRSRVNNVPGVIAESCQASTQGYDFGCSAAEDYYSCFCSSSLTLGTYMACIQKRTDGTAQRSYAINHLIKLCGPTAAETPVTEDYLETVWQNTRQFLVPGRDVNKLQRQYVPIDIDETTYKTYWRTVHQFHRQLDLGTYHGTGLLVFWGVILSVGILINFIRKVAHSTLIVRTTGKRINWLRTHFTLPALFHSKVLMARAHAIFAGVAPTRVQSVVLMTYFTLTFGLCFLQYDLFTSNIYWADTGKQLCRYVADRSGIMAFTQLPLVFLFSGRNNIMIKLTGWSYDTFNVYHRWVARVMVILALIHAIAYSIFELLIDYYKMSWFLAYWYWGILGMVACSIILFQSLYFFRSRWYEIFLVLHIVLSVLFLVGCWFHCREFGWMNWLYASIFIWILDRLIRIGRVLANGFIRTASFELFPEDGIYRVVIPRPHSPIWTFYPGCYIFIYILRGSKFWESHPFTVIESTRTEEANHLVLLIKPREGHTRDMCEYLAGQSRASDLAPTTITPLLLKTNKIYPSKMVIPVFTEGPYGHCHPINKYDTVLLIGGGIGVTAPYAYAAKLKELNSGKQQRIIFIWCISDFQPFAWFKRELAYLASNTGCCHIDVHVYVSKSPKAENRITAPIIPYTIHHNQRANLKERIPAIFKESVGSVGVLVCGPMAMNDEVKATIANNLTLASGRVDYFEESF